ncbi:MAG: D-aminoacyl-tRNA deacylase, partial [Ruminococcus sp.]|nr:D-aminoacyl-tRNA deacylase [Ruminococcus sp.]
MKAILQRTSRASVTVDGEVKGEIGKGFLILLGVENGDDEREAAALADKISGLRIFTDENDKMNLSLSD